jgi:hypothetical protein
LVIISVTALLGLSPRPTIFASSPVAVARGAHYGSRIFPDNAFTIGDRTEVTGRRVNLVQGVDYPTVNGVVQANCTSADYSICDAFAELNKLDGFDIQPRVTVPFTGAIRLDSVNDSDFFISTDSDVFVSGLRQLTFDPATNTLAGISDSQLREDTHYRIHVTNGIRDSAGNAVNACGKTCVVHSRRGRRVESSSVYAKRWTCHFRTQAMHISRLASRVRQHRPLHASCRSPRTASTTFPWRRALHHHWLIRSTASSTDQVRRSTVPGAFQTSAVPILIPPVVAGYYAFGSFLSPRYQFASATGQQDNPYGAGDGFTDGEIPPVPTTKTPAPFAADRLGAVVLTPDPSVFPPPWPAAVYGPGFTRSDYDLFVTADYNASLGIVTVATDPAGHGFGPLSTTTVTSNGAPTTFLSYGRARDLDGDGILGDGLNDGVGPTGHCQDSNCLTDSNELTSHKPLDGLSRTGAGRGR